MQHSKPKRKTGKEKIGAVLAVTAVSLGGIAAPASYAATQTPDAGQQDSNVTQETTAETTWTAIVGSQSVTLTQDANGTLTGSAALDAVAPETVAVSGSDGSAFTVSRSSLDSNRDTSVVGVVSTTGTASYKAGASDGNPAVDVEASFSAVDGKQVTVDGNAFTGATPTADAADVKLNNDDSPSVDSLTLSNGQILPVTWADGTTSSVVNGVTVVSKAGTATGTVTVTTADGYEKSWNVKANVKATRTNTWTTVIDGDQSGFSTSQDGSQTLEHGTISSFPSESITATSSAGQKVQLDLDTTPSAVVGRKLGQSTVSGTGVYSRQADGATPKFTATVPYSYTSGSEVTLDGGGTFSKDGSSFTATAPNASLDDANKPSTDSVKLSDGTKATIVWADAPTVVERDGVAYVTKTGVATGTMKVTDAAAGTTVDETFTVNVTASRAQDKSFTALSVVRSDADGKTTATGVTGFSADEDSYTLTLPHSAVNDSYTLSATTGVDADTSNVSVSLGADAARVMKMDVNGRTYTVTVKFQSADIKPDSPAKLEGIYVNRSGEASKGDLIDGWNANKLDYTVTVGEKDPSPYILPVAGDGVTVKAGDVTQNADSTKQEWVVTDTATGVSRTYSVTVAREHSWKTAAESFTPESPVAQDTVTPASSPSDAELESHGYVLNGKYVTQDKDSYTIPEGGAFSYEAKAGQSVSVSSRKVSGMTYEYTVSVLSPDASAFKQYTYTVVFLTPATHKAELTGIMVDGTAVPHFDAATHEYSVSVSNASQWTVVPQYDKLTGMSVKTVKDGATATITAISADGLATSTYTVHVTQKAIAGDGTVGVSEDGNLASTGSSVLPLVIGGIVAAIIGAGASLVALFRRSRP